MLDILRPSSVFVIDVSVFNAVGTRDTLYEKMKQFNVCGNVFRISPSEVRSLEHVLFTV